MSSYVLRVLFVHTVGTRLVLDGESVKALREDAPMRRLPLHAIDTLVVCSGVDVSTPLLVRCAEEGRTVAFLSRYGKPRAVVEGALQGRGTLRSLQYHRQFDLHTRDQQAGLIVSGKLGQMAWGLRQWARDADSTLAQQLRALAEQVQADALLAAGKTRAALMGVEGAATRRYFQGLGLALRGAGFTGRSRRPPRDPINCVLSYLYGMTRIAVHGAVHASGLDPYCGYLHGDRDDQPCLVLDLMEELRPHADRLAVALFNRQQLRDPHFVTHIGGAVELSETGRTVVMDAWHEHRQRTINLRGAVGEIPGAALPIVQAHAMANALRTGSLYTPHRMAVT